MPHESYRVLVADAATPVGIALLSYLGETEYVLRALVTDTDAERRAHNAGADEVVHADFENHHALVDAVADVDAICCTATDGGLGRVAGPLDAGRGLRNLLDAVDDDSRPYVVLHSTIGVGDSRQGMVLPRRLYNHRLLRALDETERYLRERGVPYTVLRTGATTDDARSHDVVTGEGGDEVSGRIGRADLAWLMTAALTTPEARNRTFEVASAGATTAGDAVDFAWSGPEAGLVARRSGYSIPS
ncbi:NAD(P)-binding oxidoreductase [Halorubellus sp. PRR65]|uniref:NAD(P)-binding oxidoreductase n=1 Tax=Halorubellus sp. PRR65 TaxID=3098148 RepID=UPI002B260B95|nr:NAD(P)-binding oxidoreductase [Halorubellus sp. PRR65]